MLGTNKLTRATDEYILKKIFILASKYLDFRTQVNIYVHKKLQKLAIFRLVLFLYLHFIDFSWVALYRQMFF